MNKDDYYTELLNDPDFINYLIENKIKERYHMEMAFESMLESRIKDGEIIQPEERTETRITNK
jgi:hypothetical protein